VDKHRPLLGKRLWSPALSDAAFEAPVSLRSVPFLADHRCYGVPIVPGASYLSAVVDATRRALGMSRGILEDVAFAHALLLPAGEERVVQTVLSFGDGLGEFFKVVSRRGDHEEEEPAWIVHASGCVAPSDREVAEDLALLPEAREEFQQAAAEIVHSQEFYAAMLSHNVDFGPCFRMIDTVWVGDGEALCRLRTPAGLDLDECALHPVLLDCGLQVLGGVYKYDPQSTLIPTGIERFRFCVPAPMENLWCYARFRDPNGATVGADACLFHDDGSPIAVLEGIHYDAIPRPVLLRLLGRDNVVPPEEEPRPQRELIARLEQTPRAQRSLAVLHYVRGLVNDLLGLSPRTPIGPDRGFFEAGMDSLRILQLSARLQDAVGCPLPTTLALKYTTVRTLANYLLDEVLALDLPADNEAPIGIDPPEDLLAGLDELSETVLADRLAGKLASIQSSHGTS
jgi:acyl carrier protein